MKSTKNIQILSGRYMSYLMVVLVIAFVSGCNDLLDIDPPRDRVDSETVFNSDVTAVSAMTGIYHGLMSSGFANGNFLSTVALTGMSSDELTYNNGYLQDLELFAFNENELVSQNQYAEALWESLYKSIYASNAMLEGLANSNEISGNIKNQLTGEALFIRAFCHFYAVNLFGNIPLVTSTDYQKNARISRSTVTTVYEQIINDLNEAKNLLAEGYVIGLNLEASDRVRVNKYTAAALLARAYLYSNNWVNAETEASFVIDNTDLYNLNTDLDDVFLACTKSNLNSEVIWQLMPVASPNNNVNTWEGNMFIINSSSSYRYTISDELLNAFEVGDDRLAKWVGSFDTGGPILYFPYKYKIKNGSSLSEYSMVLRLAEQYVIRAEARAWQNNISGAQSDINTIRNRALLENTTANDQETFLSAIQQERKAELFTEWGHRWFDLKRWGMADDVLEPIKSSGWQSTDELYPIPQSEMDKNSNLAPQNQGY